MKWIGLGVLAACGSSQAISVGFAVTAVDAIFTP